MSDKPMTRDQVCKFNDLILETFGRSGNNGKFGTLIIKVSDLETVMNSRFEKIEHTAEALDVKVDHLQLKLLALSCGGATFGGGLVAALLRAFS